MCDLNEERAAEIASKYGVDAVYTDYRDLLADPSIQAVSIATPDFAHREIAVAAAEAGKHILVEKPLATTVEDAEAIVNAAKKAQVKLMVDFHNRVNAPFLNAKRSIEQRRDWASQPISMLGSATPRLSPTQMLPWASRSSGLWFLASHTVDMAHWLLDDEPRRVYAVSRSGVLARDGRRCRRLPYGHRGIREGSGRHPGERMDPAGDSAERLRHEV